jgi:hypothetical protein
VDGRRDGVGCARPGRTVERQIFAQFLSCYYASDLYKRPLAKEEGKKSNRKRIGGEGGGEVQEIDGSIFNVK